MTANSFKERFNNHKKSFNDPRYENETELSKYVWQLKNNEKKYKIRWSIIKRAPSYNAGGKKCHLCLEEKLYLLKANKDLSLNKRTELFAKCRHADKFLACKFLAGKFMRTRSTKASRKKTVNECAS